jgi:hypothetical protein
VLDTAAATVAADLTLPPAGRLIVHVMKHDGTPATYPSVLVTLDGETFSVPVGGAGVDVALGDLAIDATDYATGVVGGTAVSLTAAGQLAEVTVTLPQPASFTAAVLLGNTSTPWAFGFAGFTVARPGAFGNYSLSGSLDANGQRTFTAFPPGELTVSARRCVPPSCATWEVGATTMTLAPGATGVITVRLFPE